MSHPTDGRCIFCRIVAGQLPCFKLFEDETTIAFMDINPVNPGQHYPSRTECLEVIERFGEILKDVR